MPRPDDPDSVRARRDARAYGLRAETIAALWLRAHLYRILARNYRAREGEVDIVARRGRTVVFVEVKARADLTTAATAITLQKQRRFTRAVSCWLTENPWATRCTLRADAIFVAPGALPRHVENAFELGVG